MKRLKQALRFGGTVWVAVSVAVAAGAALALAGCKEEPREAASAAAAAAPFTGDAAAGKKFAEAECKGCHGLDGKGTAPAIPNLAAQRPRYLFAALQSYKEGRRMHAALRDIATHMSEADARNLAAYYASLPPAGAATSAPTAAPYEQGKIVAGACAACHGADGNSRKPGTPSLAGQQPRYFVIALQEYAAGERKQSPMHAMLRKLSKLDAENAALYFASQTPAQREAPPAGDPQAGEPLSAVCGGCHGSHGVSTDTGTPTLAGQDFKYLVEAIKAYRTTRKRENMRLYITGLNEKEIQNIAAFYSVQKSKPVERGETLVQELTEKCNRCHAGDTDNPALPVPKIGGQDRDYLIMALRAYRDDRRESSTMHKMSLPYGDSIIESVASYYAGQAPK
jgi:cytochrome c553